MLFRKNSGNIIEINKLDFINDFEYYKEILKCKEKYSIPKEENQIEYMIKLVKQTNKNINEKNNN